MRSKDFKNVTDSEKQRFIIFLKELLVLDANRISRGLEPLVTEAEREAILGKQKDED